MPKGFKPSVFVSSTCYDLGQIRVDLKQFLESLGFDPVLSEFNSFPIDPSHNIIGNCKEAVKNRADIFILISGERYGTIADNDKSITNLEYIEARAKGTPTYILVAKNIITILPVWQKNKQGDYSNVVDSNKLFEFVESLLDTKDNWVFSFETAQDICSTIRQQLAYLFMDCLDLRAKMKPGILDDKELSEISPRSLEIIIDKPRGWEYRLFAELVKDYIDGFENLRRDLLYGVSFGKIIVLKEPKQVLEWIPSQIKYIQNTIESSVNMLNDGLSTALGEPGQPGDVKYILYIAKRFTEGYKKLLGWRLDLLSMDVDDVFQKLIGLMSQIVISVIKEMEDFTHHFYKEINYALDNYKEGTKVEQSFILTVKIPDDIFTEISEEFERVKRTIFSNL